MVTSVPRGQQAASRWQSIYFCDNLVSNDWQPHPFNETRRFDGTRYSTGRNGGANARYNGSLLRLAQNNRDYYGQSLRVMQIDKLTPTDFVETPYTGTNILTDISRRFSPHHISLHGDFISFDIRDRVS